MRPEAICVASEPFELCRAIRAPQGRATARDEPPTNKIVECEGNRATSVSSENTSADNSAAVANFTNLPITRTVIKWGPPPPTYHQNPTLVLKENIICGLFFRE